ncbi:hypothetical protein ARMGADRAFT_1031967 [Armillaria gallica]|uniref:Uncharacterized protein n=1 Tax=Armillaria gallica TaxID=47427 RepID=A0A2H3D7T4_ARMGA|nr:hypothetical protein ARMGADRAFT_1031967 [Armillaria gallica]
MYMWNTENEETVDLRQKDLFTSLLAPRKLCPLYYAVELITLHQDQTLLECSLITSEKISRRRFAEEQKAVPCPRGVALSYTLSLLGKLDIYLARAQNSLNQMRESDALATPIEDIGRKIREDRVQEILKVRIADCHRYHEELEIHGSNSENEDYLMHTCVGKDLEGWLFPSTIQFERYLHLAVLRCCRRQSTT